MPPCETTDTCRRMIARAGMQAKILQNENELIRCIRGEAGVAIISSEILSPPTVQSISAALKGQPHWSNLPIIVFVKADEDPSYLEPLGPITILQEPVNVGTLVTVARTALAYRQRQYQVRDLLAQLTTSNRAKSDFLANVSHEIRTPLSAILGFTELVMEKGVSEREKLAYSTAIRRNGQQLTALIDDILDLAKVEAGQIDFEKLEFALPEVLHEIVAAFEPQALRKGLHLTFEKDVLTPDVVKGDPVRLKQVLINIVGNAIKFTSHGFVKIRVGTFKQTEGRFCLDIEVEDTGIGISEAQAGNLFQPFTQVDGSTTRIYGGTGLGLFLSRKLLRAMGGEIVMKWSIPGGGTCFQITLPVDVQGEVPAENACETLPLSGVKVLVVDDSADNQMLIGRILNLLGANVDTANDGVEAVETAMSETYDAVLMDLQMPRMGGVEATKVLRQKGYSRPIVALTAHALKEDRQLCLSVGCTDYLTKPIQRSHLAQVLARVARPEAQTPAN